LRCPDLFWNELKEKIMKSILLVTAAVAALGIAACHKTGENAGKDLTNPGQSAPVNTVQDVAAGPVGLASAVVDGTKATNYVPAAAMADMYEVEAGKIAADRAKDPKVKAFGQMMVKDHTKSTADLKAALATAKLDITPPAELDQRRKGMLDNLKAAGDADFDLAYLHQQLAAHLEALTLHKGYADHGDNDGLKAVAAKIAPVVQMHIDQLKKIGGAKLDEATGKPAS
jgi:putative membrane protein